MNKRVILILIWVVLIGTGSSLTKLVPVNWHYILGFCFGNLTYPVCNAMLFDKDRH